MSTPRVLCLPSPPTHSARGPNMAGSQASASFLGNQGPTVNTGDGVSRQGRAPTWASSGEAWLGLGGGGPRAAGPQGPGHPSSSFPSSGQPGLLSQRPLTVWPPTPVPALSLWARGEDKGWGGAPGLSPGQKWRSQEEGPPRPAGRWGGFRWGRCEGTLQSWLGGCRPPFQPVSSGWGRGGLYLEAAPASCLGLAEWQAGGCQGLGSGVALGRARTLFRAFGFHGPGLRIMGNRDRQAGAQSLGSP